MDVIDIQAGDPSIYGLVTRNGHEIIFCGTEEVVLHFRSDYFNFWMRISFKTFGKDDVDIPYIAIPQFRQFIVFAHIFNNGDPLWRCNDSEACTRFFMPPAVFALVVYVEAVDVVFDRSYPIAPSP